MVNLACLSAQPTGIGTYGRHICMGLARHMDLHLLVSENLQGICADWGGRVVAVPNGMALGQGLGSHGKRLLWTQFQLPGVYRKRGGGLLFSPLAEAPVFSGCRYVVMVHDTIPLRFGGFFSSLTQYYQVWVPLVLQQAEHVICNSVATAEDVVRFYGVSGAKVTPIFLGYDQQIFNLSADGGKVVGAKPYFLYVGRQDRHKNLHRLLVAFARLRNYRDLELWIVGGRDGRYVPNLENHVRELGIGEQVRFLGYVGYGELPNFMRGAIALVFPSLWEGFGLPVLEAMACGTPVITSNVSSLPEVAGDAAILVDPYSIEAIADAMELVASSPIVAAEMKRRGLEQVKNFSWELAAQQTHEVLAKFA